MFTKKSDMAKQGENQMAAVNLIGAGTVIKGDVTSEGDIRVDGTIKGTLNIKGKVVVGETGAVEGEITCRNADISGRVKVKIRVEELLTLKPTSTLSGDVITGKLAIEPGAVFSGSCRMGDEVEALPFGNSGDREQPLYDGESLETKAKVERVS